jgi:hypothetical protein
MQVCCMQQTHLVRTLQGSMLLQQQQQQQQQQQHQHQMVCMQSYLIRTLQ